MSNLMVKSVPTSEFQQFTRMEKADGNRVISYLSLVILLFAGCLVNDLAFAGKTIELDASQRAWLEKHPVIRVAPDPDFAPVEWFNDSGSYQGISSDYIRIFEEKLGVRFEIVSVANWKDVLILARQKKIDVLTALASTPQREAYLSFSQPYLSMKGAIFSNREFLTIRSLTDLKGYRVAVVEGYLWDELLTPYAGDLALNRFHDLQTALISTSREVTDFTVGFHVTSLFSIKREGLHELSLVTTLPQEIGLNFGVRKDWQPLVGILDKVLASISPAQHASIKRLWVDEDTHGFWTNPVYRYAMLAILAFLLIAVLVFIVWNRMLNSRVQARSQELQKAQTQLIRAEKMESIGRLAAGVAHEVKNPLAIIQMGADYLSQELTADEIARSIIDDIDDAVQRADGVIKGLLDFSRDRELSLEPGNLNKVVKRSLQLVAHEMRQRNIIVSSSLSDDVPEIELDTNKMQQVLINLLMNSAHAIDREGELNVSSSVKVLSSNDDLDRDNENRFVRGESVLWLEVTDSGPGIREQDRQRIFDPFYTTKPVGEGTGLGLSVSRNIVNLHHGSIDIRNRAGKGASVVLIFKIITGGKNEETNTGR